MRRTTTKTELESDVLSTANTRLPLRPPIEFNNNNNNKINNNKINQDDDGDRRKVLWQAEGGGRGSSRI